MSEEKVKKKKWRGRGGGGGGGGGIDSSCAEAIGIIIGICIAMIFVPFYIIKTVSESSSSESSNSNQDLKPLAKFSVSDDVVEEGDTVDFVFKGETGDTPEKYTWDFGDHSSHSHEQNASHQYDDAGNYTVELTVTDNDNDSHSNTKTIRVIGSSEGNESSDSSSSSESSNQKIPIYDPYYFLITFLGLTAVSFVIIRRKFLSSKAS